MHSSPSGPIPGQRVADDGDSSSSRATRTWRLRTRSLEFGRLPALMGIVNVTPDSFSDGGRYLDPGRAVDHGLRLAAEGADVLDVGGESTRPYAAPVPVEEERRRIEPVVRALCERTDVPVSIDTSKPEIARAALDAGAEIINDVTGLADPEMIALAVDARVGVCVMHMRGTPRTMQDDPRYDDVVAEVFEYLKRRRDALLAAGIAPDSICLDPGIGFGKTHEHNLELIRNCRRFAALGCPLLVGHSRKGFIGKIAGATTDLDSATIGASLSLARQGVSVLRVHDVLGTRQALDVFAASGGLAEAPRKGAS